MKVKKLENLALIACGGAMLLALVLMFLAPAFSQDVLDYSGFEAFGKGFVAIFAFGANNVGGILFFVLLLLALGCIGFWIYVAVKHDKDKYAFMKLAGASLVVVLAIIIFSGMFAGMVNVNGRLSILWDGFKTTIGGGATKVFAFISLAFAYASVMLATFYAFINIGMLNVYGEDYREKELPFGENK